jgi:glucose-1-phosphatase
MLRLTKQASQGHTIRNIIFDFGGVICNIDTRLSEKKFRELGFRGFKPSYSVEEREDVFRKLEGGKISIPEFTGLLKRHLREDTTGEDVIMAWNAMILDIPAERVRLLAEVRKTYRIFILSNSNEIHYHKYLAGFREKYGYNSFEDLFEKAWFSFRIHLQKPSPAVFSHVIADGRLVPGETLFIDDSAQHLGPAADAGLRTYLLSPSEDITELFEEAG